MSGEWNKLVGKRILMKLQFETEVREVTVVEVSEYGKFVKFRGMRGGDLWQAIGEMYPKVIEILPVSASSRTVIKEEMELRCVAGVQECGCMFCEEGIILCQDHKSVKRGMHFRLWEGESIFCADCGRRLTGKGQYGISSSGDEVFAEISLSRTHIIFRCRECKEQRKSGGKEK